MRLWGRFVASVLLVGIVSARAYSQDLPPEVIAYPQMVLHNGKILTVDQSFSVAQAVAVRDGRILAVGTNDRILRLAGPNTERIDLQGKTVIPGFIDTHAHYGDYGVLNMLLEEKGIQWEGEARWLGLFWKDVDMALRDIKRAVGASSPGELVRVPISLEDKSDLLSRITMAQLDAISPQNPVVVVTQVSVGPAAVNSKAIELAKIPSNTPGLPQGGGVTIGGNAQQMLAQYLRWAVPIEKVVPWHKKTQERANSWGLTTVITRITPDEFDGIRELWVRGELTLRWRVGFPGPVDPANMGNISDMGDDWLRIAGGEGPAIGGPSPILGQGHWSSRLEPMKPGESSDAMLARWPQVRQQLLELLRYGWSAPNSHILGDIAVREVLDVMQEARRNPVVRSSNQRFTMDHMVELDDKDIPRIKQLGVVASNLTKDLFSVGPIGYSTFETTFGREYVNKLVPLKKYLDAGIHPTIEADTGERIKGEPLWTIERAVCRCVDGSDRIVGADQKVSREDALRMKTIWAAAKGGDERKLGSLEPGKLADLVVLDGDYLTVPENHISKLKVVLTIVGGKKALPAQ